MAVIIEVQDSSIRGVHRYILEHNEITIGRGYRNDVVVDDPYADPLHAVVSLEDEQLTVTDQSSLNGVQDSKGRALSGKAIVRSGDSIVIGQTQIRLLDEQHPLAETLPLHNHSTLGKRLHRWLGNIWFAILLSLLSGVLYLDEIYLDTLREQELSHYLTEGLTYYAGLLIITAILSFIGKVARKHWHFAMNLSFVSLLAIGGTLLEQPFSILQFNFSFGSYLWLFDVISVTLLCTLLAMLFLFNLPLQKRLYRHLITSSVALLVFGFLFVTEQRTIETKYVYSPPTSNVFISTELPWANPLSEEAFAKRSEQVYAIEIKAAAE